MWGCFSWVWGSTLSGSDFCFNPGLNAPKSPKRSVQFLPSGVRSRNRSLIIKETVPVTDRDGFQSEVSGCDRGTPTPSSVRTAPRLATCGLLVASGVRFFLAICHMPIEGPIQGTVGHHVEAREKDPGRRMRWMPDPVRTRPCSPQPISA